MQKNIELNLIVAKGLNRVIGNKGGMPKWKLPSDMNNFKRLTIPFPMIMGRKTWESFKGRILPERDHIIITNDKNFSPHPTAENVHVCNSLQQAIKKAVDLGFQKANIIGGGQIYFEALSGDYHIHEIIATEIDGVFEGDVLFPVLDPAIWKRSILKTKGRGEGDSHEYQIISYTLY